MVVETNQSVDEMRDMLVNLGPSVVECLAQQSKPSIDSLSKAVRGLQLSERKRLEASGLIYGATSDRALALPALVQVAVYARLVVRRGGPNWQCVLYDTE